MNSEVKQPDSYEFYKKQFNNESRIAVYYVMMISAAVNFFVWLLSIFFDVIQDAAGVYFCGMVWAVICIYNCTVLRRRELEPSGKWNYFLWAGILLEAVVLGTFYQRSGNATIYCVILAALSALMLDRPIKVFFFAGFFSALCAGLSLLLKEPSVASMDVVNIASSLIIGSFITSYITRVRINELQQKRKIVKQRDKDPMTNLYNRIAAKKCIDDHLAVHDGLCAMMILDIDHFKTVNDVFGHMYGDRVIRETAEKIKQIFRDKDYCCRLGGDEFMIFMTELPDESVVRKRAEQVNRSIYRSLSKDNRKYVISASIGICFTGPDAGSYQSLYKCADIALYISKKNGRNRFTVYRENSKNLIG